MLSDLAGEKAPEMNLSTASTNPAWASTEKLCALQVVPALFVTGAVSEVTAPPIFIVTGPLILGVLFSV